MKKAKRMFLSVLSIALMSVLCLSFAACGEPEKKPPVDPDPDDGGNTPAPTAVALIVDTPPARTQYYVGETVDLSGIVLKVEYNDGLKGRVSVNDCTVTPAGPLSANDTKVTISYAYTPDNVVSVEQPLTIKNVAVESVTVDTGNMALKGAVGTPMDFSGMVVTAVYEDDVARVIDDYTVTVTKDNVETVVEDPSAIVFETRGDYTVTVSYGGKSASFEVSVLNGFIIEAENIIASAEITEDDRNFVEKVAGGFYAFSKESEPASGGAYMGSVFKDAVMRFHVFAEEDHYANVILRASSSYMTEDGGSWSPVVMGDQQFNRMFDVKYGSAAEAAAQTLKPLYIDDDVILRGGSTDNPKGDPLLYVNWMDVNFGTLALKSGDNVIEMKVVTDYVNCRDQTVACNIDRLEIEYTDAAPVTVSSIDIKTEPTDKEYYEGEAFDPTGMEIEATMSDDSKIAVDPADCTFAPSGALSASDTSVTVEYRGETATMEIDVIPVSSIAVTHVPDKTSYMIGETFDPTGMEIEATMGNNEKMDVPLSACTITPAGALTAVDTTVTISYCGKETTQAIAFVQGTWTIEGENIKAVSPDEKNYVEIVRNGYVGAVSRGASETAGEGELAPAEDPRQEIKTSGNAYLNNLWGEKDDKKGALIRFHINSDTARRAKIVIYAASVKTEKWWKNQAWKIGTMGDVQFNQIFDVKFGGDADGLQAVPVDDSVVVRGGTTADDENYGPYLWENWRAIELGTFALVAGNNILQLENINSTITDMSGQVIGMKIDKLVVEYV